MNAHVKDLEDRLRDVIIGTCNTVGCKNCGLKWDGGCSAVDLQDQISDAERNAAAAAGIEVK